MTIIPLLHRILVRPEKFEEHNEDIKRAKALGLTIPKVDDTRYAEHSVDEGVIISIGDTAYRDYNVEIPIKVGDTVNYAKYSGKFIKDPETKEDLLILNDEDIICVIKKD